jgi:hypothetical protein
VIAIIVRPPCATYVPAEGGHLMFEKKFPWGKVATTFVIGAAAGAIAAVFFTPVSGRKMQKRFAHVVEDQVGNVEKMMKKVVNA